MRLTVSEAISAIGKAHQTRLTLPERESSQAAGSRTTSCLQMETVIDKTLFPKAWNTAPKAIQIPAKA